MKRARFSWRYIVVGFTVLAIFTSVATRSFDYSWAQQPTAQSDLLKAKRQHFDTDALEFAEPLAQLIDMLLPVAAPHAPRREVAVTSLELAEYLYNRPPPSNPLL